MLIHCGFLSGSEAFTAMSDQESHSLSPSTSQRISINRTEYFAYVLLIAVNSLFTVCGAIIATEGCGGTAAWQREPIRICQQSWLRIGPCISSGLIALLFLSAAFVLQLPRWSRFVLLGGYIVANVVAVIVWRHIFTTPIQ